MRGHAAVGGEEVQRKAVGRRGRQLLEAYDKRALARKDGVVGVVARHDACGGAQAQ